MADGSQGDAVGGVEEHLLELARQVAAPYQSGGGGERGSVGAGADHAVGAAAGSGSAGSGQFPVRCCGPVRTAVGRLAVATKARVIGSDRRNGGSVKLKRGLHSRMTASHAS